MLTCDEIDEYERSLGTTIKAVGRSILQEYKDLVEDEDSVSFNQELSKFSSTKFLALL